jgi:hypothetical protein
VISAFKGLNHTGGFHPETVQFSFANRIVVVVTCQAARSWFSTVKKLCRAKLSFAKKNMVLHIIKIKTASQNLILNCQ